jgi:Mor family transcriptional regulator
MIKSEQNKRDAKIKKTYEEGKSVRVIAGLFGLTTQQTYNILKDNGIQFKKHLTNNLEGV